MTISPFFTAPPRIFAAPSRTWLPLVAGFFSFGSALARGSALLADPDVYLHIAVGRWIIGHRLVPHRDIFSYSMQGSPWVPHEWLSEVILAFSYEHFGWIGLFILAGFAFALAMALLARALLAYLPPTYAVIGTLSAWAMTFPNVVARPHVFTFPLVVAWIAVLVLARSRDKAPPPRAVLLMLLWANLHGSFMIGLVFCGLFAGEALFDADDRHAARRVVIGWGVFGLLSTAAAFATPNGVAGMLLPLDMARMNFALSFITEWQSPNFQHPQPLEIWLLLLLFGILLMGIRLPITRIVMLLALLHLALLHQRHVMLLGLITPLLIAPSLSPQLPRRPDELIRAFFKSSLDLRLLTAVASTAVVAIALTLTFEATTWYRSATRDADRFVPAAALAAVRAHQITGPVFNDFNFGGFLIFSGVPTFIDGRADVYGDGFIRRYATPEELPGLLSQYHVTWTLLGAGQPDVLLLDHLPGWQRLYADSVAVVHTRE
jgi:hypothetical protein